MVHGSGGINLPASEHLRSEVAIVAGIAQATLGNAVLDWAGLADDYDRIREMIARVLPAFADFNERVRVPRGFWLRNPASEREWRTPGARARFSSRPSDAPTVETIVERIGPLRNKTADQSGSEGGEGRRRRRA